MPNRKLNTSATTPEDIHIATEIYFPCAYWIVSIGNYVVGVELRAPY